MNNVSSLFQFLMKIQIPCVNSIALDKTPHSEVTRLELHCLPLSKNRMLGFYGLRNNGSYQMSLVLRKQVLGVSDQVPHKPGSTATEDG